MKLSYNGYDISTAKGQKDLFYQGKFDPNKPLSSAMTKSIATEEDIKLLNELGLEGLKKKEYFGVIDRLKNSNIVKD